MNRRCTSRILPALIVALFLGVAPSRSGNALTLELTAAINDLSPDERLSEGQIVKIGKKEPLEKPEEP